MVSANMKDHQRWRLSFVFPSGFVFIVKQITQAHTCFCAKMGLNDCSWDSLLLKHLKEKEFWSLQIEMYSFTFVFPQNFVRHHWVHRRRQEGKCKQCGKVRRCPAWPCIGGRCAGLGKHLRSMSPIT